MQVFSYAFISATPQVLTSLTAADLSEPSLIRLSEYFFKPASEHRQRLKQLLL